MTPAYNMSDLDATTPRVFLARHGTNDSSVIPYLLIPHNRRDRVDGVRPTHRHLRYSIDRSGRTPSKLHGLHACWTR